MQTVDPSVGFTPFPEINQLNSFDQLLREIDESFGGNDPQQSAI